MYQNVQIKLGKFENKKKIRNSYLGLLLLSKLLCLENPPQQLVSP